MIHWKVGCQCANRPSVAGTARKSNISRGHSGYFKPHILHRKSSDALGIEHLNVTTFSQHLPTAEAHSPMKEDKQSRHAIIELAACSPLQSRQAHRSDQQPRQGGASGEPSAPGEKLVTAVVGHKPQTHSCKHDTETDAVEERPDDAESYNVPRWVHVCHTRRNPDTEGKIQKPQDQNTGVHGLPPLT